MKNLSSVFIGIVDILGYTNAEHCIDQYGTEASSQILGRLYSSLDTQVENYKNGGVHWIRYGDGYVFYSETKDIELLATMIKNAINLLALSLCQSIPLRISITQGDIKIIDAGQSGLSITGTGWNALQTLEKSLDWMGGCLYLPHYDNHHYPMIKQLLTTTHLIIQQNNCSEKSQNFSAPFKESNKYSKERVWFFNWHKVLHQQNHENDTLVKNWWHGFTNQNINEDPAVQKKQKNTLEFAYYCNELYQSSKLVYFSQVQPDLNISEIMDHK